jgi:hypothetical protein
MLPNEPAVERDLASRFGNQFTEMTALHTFAVSILAPQITIKGSKGVDGSVVYVCLGLFVKACRQFRSVQHLCQAGLGSDAHALTRNLFETWLALMFVARRRVTLKQGKKRLGSVGKRALGSRLRARLYLANAAFESERVVKDWESTVGLKRSAKVKLDGQSIRMGAADAATAIGAEWTKRLKEKKSYSGLNLRELAHSFRVDAAYATLYRSASWSTHAVDLNQFLANTANGLELKLEPSDDWIEPTIGGASLTLVCCIDVLNDRFHLALDSQLAPYKAKHGLKP